MSDCSRAAQRYRQIFHKFRAAVQSTRPLDIMETAGVWPIRTSSLSILALHSKIRAPSSCRWRNHVSGGGKDAQPVLLVRLRQRYCHPHRINHNFCSRVSLVGWWERWL